MTCGGDLGFLGIEFSDSVDATGGEPMAGQRYAPGAVTPIRANRVPRLRRSIRISTTSGCAASHPSKAPRSVEVIGPRSGSKAMCSSATAARTARAQICLESTPPAVDLAGLKPLRVGDMQPHDAVLGLAWRKRIDVAAFVLRRVVLVEVVHGSPFLATGRRSALRCCRGMYSRVRDELTRTARRRAPRSGLVVAWRSGRHQFTNRRWLGGRPLVALPLFVNRARAVT